MTTALAAAPAIALPTAGVAAAAAERGEREWGARIFDRVDADGDGRITRAEAETAHAASFERMDANADGRLERDEMAGAATARMQRRLAKRFESLDANGDGAVARAELAGQSAERFGRLDGDGAPTRDEIASGLRRGG